MRVEIDGKDVTDAIDLTGLRSGSISGSMSFDPVDPFIAHATIYDITLTGYRRMAPFWDVLWGFGWLLAFLFTLGRYRRPYPWIEDVRVLIPAAEVEDYHVNEDGTISLSWRAKENRSEA